MTTASPLCDDKELVDKSPTDILEQVPSVDPTRFGLPESAVQTSRVWWKLDLLVLPVVFLIALCVSLDAANIGNARIAGLQQHLDLSDKEFTVALMVTFIPIFVVELPSSYLMTVVGPHIICSICLILLGVTNILQGVVTTYPEFLACRLFSGIFLGSIQPGGVVYLAGFYPRRMLQFRLSFMLTSTILAPSISSLIAAGVGRMDGVLHRSRYSWLFLLEGTATVVLGFIALLILPKNPASVKFLLNEPERQFLARIVADDSVTPATSEHTNLWYALRRTVVQPHIILNILAGFLIDVTSTGLTYFLPTVVVGLGFEGTKAQLMSAPPFAVGTVFSLLTSLVSDRYNCRGLTVASCAGVAAVGFAIYIASGQNSIRYMSLVLGVAGNRCVSPALTTWQSNNIEHPVRRALVIAFTTVVVGLGAFLSVWLFGTLSAPPKYTSATITLLACQVAVILCAVLELVYLRAQNRRKQLAQEAYVREHGERPSSVAYDSIWFEYVM